MRLPLAAVLLVLVVWSVILIAIFYVLAVSDQFPSQGSRWQELMQSLTRAVPSLRGQSTLQPERLPHILDRGPGGDDHSGRMHIYFLWQGEDHAFNLFHYLSLESALALYPRAMYTFLVFSVNHVDIHAHKTDGILASNKFQKYRKLGYDINVVLLEVAQHADNRYISSWLRQNPHSALCGNCSVPAHLASLLALQRLQQTGGLLLSPSFYLLDTLDGVDYGHYINAYCLSPAERPHLRTYRPKVYDHWPHLLCTADSLLFARHRDDAVVSCVLDSFADDKLLQVCIDSDQHYGGALCVSKVYDQCLQRQESQQHQRVRGNPFAGVAPDDEQVLAVASRRGDVSVHTPAASGPLSAVVPTEATAAVVQGAEAAGTGATGGSTVATGAAVGVLETFDHDPFRATAMLTAAHNWTLREASRVLFMGVATFPYALPAASLQSLGVGDNPLLRPSLLRSAVLQSRSLRKAVTGLLTLQPHITAAMEATPSNATTFLPVLDSSTVGGAEEEAGCYGYAPQLVLPSHLPYLSPGDLRAPMPTSHSLRVEHSSLLLPRTSCAPSLVVAGFPHTPAAALLQALARHPLVLTTQCGDYASSESYVSVAGMTRRGQCFPLIEPGERFVSMDGNLHLDLAPFAPFLLRQDNPHAKALLVLRNPVQRLYLHFAQTLRAKMPVGVSFDEAVRAVIADAQAPLSRLRELVVRGASVQHLLSAFFEPAPAASGHRTLSPTSAVGSDRGSAGPVHLPTAGPGAAGLVNGTDAAIGSSLSLLSAPSQASSPLLPSHTTALLNSNATQLRMVQGALRHSLYALVVQHYVHALGAEQVVILHDEDGDSLPELLSALGLVTLRSFIATTQKRFHAERIAENRALEAVPPELRMSQDMYCRLTTFFAPFNALLANVTRGANVSLVGRANFTAWELLGGSGASEGDHVQRLWDSLPEFAASNGNQSWPRMWFEDEPQTEVPKMLSQRLVPQRVSAEDSGYNTTLGMLNTF